MIRIIKIFNYANNNYTTLENLKSLIKINYTNDKVLLIIYS